MLNTFTLSFGPAIGWALRDTGGRIMAGQKATDDPQPFADWLDRFPAVDLVYFDKQRHEHGSDGAKLYNACLETLAAWCGRNGTMPGSSISRNWRKATESTWNVATYGTAKELRHLKDWAS